MSDGIVLDIDETLGHTVPEFDNKTLQDLRKPENFAIFSRIVKFNIHDPRFQTGTEHRISLYFIKRPGLDEFLKWCFQRFKVVAIWSAGSEAYVRALIPIIFAHTPQPHIVFSADNLPVGTHSASYTKPLRVIYEKYPDLHLIVPFSRLKIVDDRKENFIPNPANGVLIPAYSPDPNINSMQKEDRELEKIMKI